MSRADIEAVAEEKYPDTFGTDRHPWWVARERAAYIQGRLDALPEVPDDAVIEAMARALAHLEPGEDWPTNAELGGGPTGTRDDEFREDLRDEARAAYAALRGAVQ